MSSFWSELKRRNVVRVGIGKPHAGLREAIVHDTFGAELESIVETLESAGWMRGGQRLKTSPRGYDTDIGESGQALSPGQRQRIALARALYGNPRLVVLDEPNANLDNDGDEALIRTLRVLKEEGATVVVIAHRPSLIAGVDKILVLREGAAEMFGPRAEVMARITRPAPARGVA